MAKDNESTMKWKVDISQLKAAMQDAKRSISLANAEFKAATAGMDKWQNSTTGLEAKIKQLNTTLPKQRTILQQLEKQYAIVADQMGEDSAEAQKLKIQIENQKAAINKTEAAIGTYNKKLKDMQTAEASLTNTIKKQEAQLASLKTAYVDAVAQYGKNSKEAKSLASQIETLSGNLAENKAKMNEASDAANKLDKSYAGVKTSADSVDDGNTKMEGGFTVLKGAMANLVAEGVMGLIDGFMKLGAVMIDTGKKAISSYADYEQLVGGVETLFGTNGRTIEEYAESVGKTVDEVSEEYQKMVKAQETVLANAAEAYKTAGVSQNEYMETVTSFSASLIQSLAGDTQKAAELSNQAIIDMSDNANKMGTDMGSIMYAYQGFAKQNFTMLDNLKLGYGGTKEEMQRLLDDANELKVAQGGLADLTIDSYADIIEAIHMVQDEMGITGTTQKEAASTITGSLNMTKAAWSNLLTGMADDTADFDTLIDNFVQSATAFANNIVPRIKTTITGFGKVVVGLMHEIVPEITKAIPEIASEMIPAFMEAMSSIVSAIKEMLPSLMTLIPELLGQFTQFLPEFLDMGVNLITSIATGVLDALPTVVDNLLEAVKAAANALANNVPQMLTMLPEIITELVDVITSQLPSILEVGVDLVMALIQGIFDTIPVLMDAIPQIVEDLIHAIINLLPQIVDSALMLVEALAEGLIENVPIIIDAALELLMGIVQAIPKLVQTLSDQIPKLVLKICDLLTEMLPELIDAATELLFGIIETLPVIISTLNDEIPKIVVTIIDTLIRMIPDLLDAATKLLMAIVEALPELSEKMMEELPKLLDMIIELITNYSDNMIECAFMLFSALLEVLPEIITLLVENVPKLVETIMEQLVKKMPDLMKASVKLLGALITAIIKFLPTLAAATPKLVMTLMQVLIQNLPNLITAGITLLGALISAIIQFLPQLALAAPRLVSTIIKVLIDSIPDLIKAGVKLLGALITAIPQFLPDLIKAVPQIIQGIKDALGQGWDAMKEAGLDLVKGIWEGISGGYDWIKEKITGWVGNVTDFFKEVFGIGSPSKVMRDQIGKWIPEGWAAGVEEDMPNALNEMKHTVNGAMNSLKSDISIQSQGIANHNNSGKKTSGSSQNGSKSQTINFNQTINSPKPVDRLSLYRETNNLLFSAKVRLGNV